MKILITLLLIAGSVAAQAAPIGIDGARHLLERSGFGAPPSLLAEYSRLERAQAVDRLLNGKENGLQSRPPEIPYERPASLKNLSEDERKAVQRERVRQGGEMRAWWAGEMLRAPTAQDALRERMTLFWHNHFVSSQQKVKSGTLMLRQNELLRRHALGNFGGLLHAVAKDPAMLVYLDGASNRKTSPNENFAREVMELFTLGEGRYQENDIKEAARAFSGWSFAPQTGDYLWRPAIHDDGEKVILGRRGNFDGDGVLDILLAQPATAQFIAAKLWREFISPQPDTQQVSRIAAALRGAGYEIRPALRAVFMAEAFWAPANRGSLIKAPVDFIIGTTRTLAVEVPDALPLALALRNLGQDLFAPPNVRGWPGGDAWINSTTLLARKQFIERLLRANQMERTGIANRESADPADGKLRMVAAMRQIHFDSAAWMAPYRDFSGLQLALLAVPPVQEISDSRIALPLLRTLLLDPVFQLK